MDNGLEFIFDESPTSSQFAALFERYRRELHVHCYRMVGSFDDAEDLTQDTMLRAWRGRSAFEGRSSLRTWLYRIATNLCLDYLSHSSRRAVPVSTLSSTDTVPWLQPYPDVLLDETNEGATAPESSVVERETIELVFITAIQLLPPRQRAVLVLRDVLGWSADETAALVEITTPAANSLLQRARHAVRCHTRDRLSWSPPSEITNRQRAMLQRYTEAHESGDTNAVIAMLREDLRVSMPPDRRVWSDRESYVAHAFRRRRPSRWRLVSGMANRQPMVAFYLRRGDSDSFKATALQVLRLDGGDRIGEIVAFRDPTLFRHFDLPDVLP